MEDKTEELSKLPLNEIRPEWAEKQRRVLATPVFPREVGLVDLSLVRSWYARADANLKEVEQVPGMSDETIGYYKGYCTALANVLGAATQSQDVREEAAKAANPAMPGWFPALVIGTFCVGILMVLGWALFS